MSSPTVKIGVFILEGLNALATTYYFYYIYFFMQAQFGFGRLQNLLLAAALGLVYMLGSIWGGRFAQRRGYFLALRLGFLIMAVMLALGSRLDHLPGHFAVLVISLVGMCLTWPTLEALVSEGEKPARLQRMVGLYNLIWASGSAFAYFTGGAMIEHWGLTSMFLVPAAMNALQLVLVFWLAKHSLAATAEDRPENAAVAETELNPRPIGKAKIFLKMAWLANPFAYLAINTVLAVVPSLAQELQLSPMFAGFFCSVWLFVRVGSFVLFWLWPGWHYRFRWLVAAYVIMTVSFALMLLVPDLFVLVLAQAAFGVSLGLIYYSSLFYSMDVGETKGEHGGFHEGMIGAGSCAGPAIGAAGLYFFPGIPGSSAWAVSAMLLVGLAGLVWLRVRK